MTLTSFSRRSILGAIAAVATVAMAGPAMAEDLPSADELLAKVDKNLTSKARSNKTVMTVTNPRKTRTYELNSWGRGEAEAAMEYLAPTRDKGTKILRNANDLWTYFPAVERTQKISGHMLRQGLMGSDVSYEDMTTSTELRTAYDAKCVGVEEKEGRKTYKLEMTAKDDSVSYPKRYAWVDAEHFIPVRQELFALSGMLLKTWIMKDVKTFEGGRNFPMTMIVEDTVQEGTSTMIQFSDVKFDVALSDEILSEVDAVIKRYPVPF